MKQITEEQGLAIIKQFRAKNSLEFDVNDILSFKDQMKDKQCAYLCEASISEPDSEDADRIGKLLEILKPEIDGIGKKPCYFHVQIVLSSDVSLLIDEMNAMSDFMDCYEDIELKWTINTIDGDDAHAITMRIITVTE